MFDLTRKEIAGLERFGFKRIYSVEGLKEGTFFETKDPNSVRLRAGRGKLFLVHSYDPDIAMIKAVGESGAAFVLSLNEPIRGRGVERAILLSKQRFFLSLCRKYGAQYVLCSLANDEFEARTTKECVSIGMLLGLTYEQACASLERLPNLLGEKNESDP
jgi:hypothetical protein